MAPGDFRLWGLGSSLEHVDDVAEPTGASRGRPDLTFLPSTNGASRYVDGFCELGLSQSGTFPDSSQLATIDQMPGPCQCEKVIGG